MERGRLVTGIVLEQREFGGFVDIGEAEPALAVITMLEDDPRPTRPHMPRVGQEIEAVLLGYSGPGRQPRLSLRPSDIAEAVRAG